jgi:hypothetical protein
MVSLFVMGASSQKIRSAMRNRSAISELMEILHVVVSEQFKGMLNLECVVRPPGRSNDAIPLEATERAILLLLTVRCKNKTSNGVVKLYLIIYTVSNSKE